MIVILRYVIFTKQKLTLYPTNCKAKSIDYNTNVMFLWNWYKIGALEDAIRKKIKVACVLRLKKFMKFLVIVVSICLSLFSLFFFYKKLHHHYLRELLQALSKFLIVVMVDLAVIDNIIICGIANLLNSSINLGLKISKAQKDLNHFN